METGFLNLHDEEHFSSNIYDQNNVFESEHSLFNGLVVDCNSQTPSSPSTWTWPEIASNDDTEEVKEEREDYQKTFINWQQHISSLQNKDKVFPSTCDYLATPFTANMPDIFLNDPPREGCNQEPVIKQEDPPFPANEKDDYQKTFSNWQEHLNNLENKDKSFSSLTVPPVSTCMPDIFLNDPSDSIKVEPLDSSPHKTLNDLPFGSMDDSTDMTDLKPSISVIEAGGLSSLLEQFEAVSNSSSSLLMSKIDDQVHLHRSDIQNGQLASSESAHLDHDYCSSASSPERKDLTPIFSKSNWEKKDSGLDSGEYSDNTNDSCTKSSSQALVISCPVVKQEPRSPIRIETPPPPPVTPLKEVKVEKTPQPLPIFEVVKKEPEVVKAAPPEPPKKKKLNLEEYRNRRRNMPPISVKTERISKEEKPLMVNAEVQTALGSKVQPPVSKEPSPRAKRFNSSPRYRRRSLSSSSYSSTDYRRSRRRGRTPRRRRRRSRSQRSAWSRSSSESSRSSSRSRSRSSRSRRSRSRGRRRRSSNYSSGSFKGRRTMREDDWPAIEKKKQMEERRVVYVGQIDEGMTKAQLRERFQVFGPIVDISLHFRERGDNYGFVTYAYKMDAYEAVEHGNDNPHEKRYDICFGGRRAFCRQKYSDLDGMSSGKMYSPYHQSSSSRSNDSFDNLLREVQEKMRKSKASSQI